MTIEIAVTGIPDWVDGPTLLGPGDWECLDQRWQTTMSRPEAADVSARLRGVHIGGTEIAVSITPPLKRPLIRAARTRDAKIRRMTTPGFERRGTQWDEVGRYSLTPERLAMDIASTAAKKRVVDAGCGVGGNAIGFARHGCEVVALDSNQKRLNMAKHNAHIYGVEKHIVFQHVDVFEALHTLSGDILFMDPPWGLDWNKKGTFLADLPLLDTLLKRPKCTRGFQQIWVKVPPSFDPNTLGLPYTASALFGKEAGDQHRVKFLLLKMTIP